MTAATHTPMIPEHKLIYNGVVIRDHDAKLSLTDMWKAAGSPPNREPFNWARKEGSPFIAATASAYNLPISQVMFSQQGKGGGTWAHWQIGLAYAKYLNHDFHMWCNDVVRAHMEGTPVPVENAMAILSSPEKLRSLLLTYSERTLALEQQVKELQPSQEALRRLSEADGSLCITDAAKALQMRPRDLFVWLRQNGWVYKRPGSSHDLGYSSKTMAGLLEHKVTTVLRADGSEKVTEQVRVTAKGLTKLAQLIKPAIREA